jgi:hypothetical protein
MQKSTLKTIYTVLAFSIAMGFLEAAVVVYIRELYYPEGFSFPLKMMSMQVAITEIFRELATLVMLVTAGMLAGRTKTEKFGYFIFTFAVWDIFYYIFLKLLINWPESLLTWDILFLLPTAWVGPVIAPVLLAILMIILSLAISYFTDKQLHPRIQLSEWSFLILGSLISIIAFTLEYTVFITGKYSFSELWNIDSQFIEYAIQFIPQKFPWIIFLTGFGIIATGIGKFYYRNFKIYNSLQKR